MDEDEQCSIRKPTLLARCFYWDGNEFGEDVSMHVPIWSGHGVQESTKDRVLSLFIDPIP